MSGPLLIVSFMPQEARPLLKRLRTPEPLRGVHGKAWRGEFGGVPAVVAQAGMGRANAEKAFVSLYAVASPSALAVCGVAAGLDPTLQVGDGVVATAALDELGELRPAPSPVDLPVGWRAGRLLTVTRILVSTAAKRGLGEAGSGHALAADMETFFLACLAGDAGIPWCALRGISDTAAEDLPLDFNRSLGTDGAMRIGRLMLNTAALPAALPGLLRLARDTVAAGERAAEAAHVWLPRWFTSVRGGEGPGGAPRSGLS